MELLDDFQQVFAKLEKVPEFAVEATKEVIDEETLKYEASLRKSVPIRTGGLQSSLKATKISSPEWYGYKIEFEGTAPNGEPYQKIANILNYGSAASSRGGGIAGLHFIEKNIRILRSINLKIYTRFQAKLNK